MSTDIPNLEAANNRHHPPSSPRSDSPSSFSQITEQEGLVFDLETSNRTSSTTVEIPVALLESLLNTIDTLRKEVALLHNDLIERIDTMSSEFETVNNNMEDYLRAKTFQTFTCFRELPLELRRQIWNAALEIPQIIPMRLSNVPFEDADATELQAHANPLSKHSHLLGVNQESRREAKKVYVQSQVSAHKCASHIHNTILADLTNDILWFPDVSEAYALKMFITSMGAHLSQSKAQEAKPICRLAVRQTAWTDFLSTALHNDHWAERWNVEFLYMMTEMGLRELILIANDTTTSGSTNAIFTTPKGTPSDSGIRPEVIQRLGLSPDCSWEELTKSTDQFLIGMEEKRLIKRQTLLRSGKYYS
jgi:hypothetical protein